MIKEKRVKKGEDFMRIIMFITMKIKEGMQELYGNKLIRCLLNEHSFSQLNATTFLLLIMGKKFTRIGK